MPARLVPWLCGESPGDHCLLLGLLLCPFSQWPLSYPACLCYCGQSASSTGTILCPIPPGHSRLVCLPHHIVCEIRVPWPGIEPVPPEVEVQSLNHWTARDVPAQDFEVTILTLQVFCIIKYCKPWCSWEKTGQLFFKVWADRILIWDLLEPWDLLPSPWRQTVVTQIGLYTR